MLKARSLLHCKTRAYRYKQLLVELFSCDGDFNWLMYIVYICKSHAYVYFDIKKFLIFIPRSNPNLYYYLELRSPKL